jgi:hypothetical protein
MITIRNKSNIIRMDEMKPLQVGVVHSSQYKGIYVLRTASVDKFEVMNLSDPQADECWLDSTNQMVRLLDADESLTIELRNEI